MQGKRDNDYSGNVNVGVAPSVKVRPGVCINVNDHYEVDSPKESLGSNEMLSVLTPHKGIAVKPTKKLD